MYKVILVDDEQPALQRLSKLIQSHTDFHVAAAFNRATEALSTAASFSPQAAFLDIEMPGMNGLELANRLMEMCPDLDIVIVTAFSEYALQAFRVNAIDYLVKPVSPEDIKNCAMKLKKRQVTAVGDEVANKLEGNETRIVGFGGFEVFAPNSRTPIRFTTAKCEELLAFLLVNRNVSVSKWDLCEQIWPGQDLDKAEQNLHTSIYRLKKTLLEYGISVRLESQKGSYRLTASCSCDFFEPDSSFISRGNWNEDDIPILESIVQLYRGPLFAGKAYAWCEALRERMERRYSILSKRLSALHFAAGRDGQAIEVLQTLTIAAPYDEDAYELLFNAYDKFGDRVAFLQLYRKMEHVFRNELGLEPSPSVQLLYKRLEGLT